MKACNRYQDMAARRNEFEDKVKPALLSRCLLSSYTLSDPKGKQLHHAYKDAISHFPRYMTTLELMEHLDSMTPSHRNPFLDHLSEDRAIVIEDWVNRLGASAGATVYDHSVMFMPGSRPNGDDSMIYKGQCDASFNNGKAKLCVVIWCRDKVLSCIIVKDFECDTSVEAEATAMYILLKEGISLGLHGNFFMPCTDCSVVYEVLWGAHRIDENSPLAPLYKLLKFMRCYYKKLIPKFEPREKMMFVDGLMKVPEDDELKQIQAVLRKLKLDLSGHPIFKFTQKSTVTTKLAKSKPAIPLEVERSCYLEVEEKNQIDTAYHVISAMRPVTVLIIARDVQSEQDKLFDLFEDCEIGVSKMNDYNMFALHLQHRSFDKLSTKVLRIVMDDMLPVQEVNDDDDIFTVHLIKPNGIKLDLPELSPASFISFHQPPKKNGLSGQRPERTRKPEGCATRSIYFDHAQGQRRR